MAETAPGAGRRADRFLGAFSSVEKSLQRIAGLAERSAFGTMLQIAKQQSSAVRQYEAWLRELADLRNAIVHERTDARPIADPYEETVVELERISRVLANPPSLLSVVGRAKVTTLAVEDTIGSAAQKMKENDFSQLPVYSGSAWAGLVTTEAITHWLASHLPGAGIVEDEMVSAALPRTESFDTCKFVNREATVFDAVEAFAEANRSGRRLEAILITDSGNQNQRPLGIATVADLPRLYDAAAN